MFYSLHLVYCNKVLISPNLLQFLVYDENIPPCKNLIMHSNDGHVWFWCWGGRDQDDFPDALIYQSTQGDNMFLDPLCWKMLEAQFPDTDDLPDRFTARIKHFTKYTLNEQNVSRNRHLCAISFYFLVGRLQTFGISYLTSPVFRSFLLKKKNK